MDSRLRLYNLVFLSAAILLLGACTLPKKRSAEEPDISEVSKQPLSEEETKELLGDVATNWWYGQGVGDTAITVGTTVLFPPYAIVLLGNAALSLSGYETVGVSNLLPEEQGKAWKGVYDNVASSPGKLNAAVAGREFRTKEVIKEDLSQYIKRDEKVTVDNIP